jgi:Urea transporter
MVNAIEWIKILMRGFGQVMFRCNAVSGALFFAGICAAAIYSHNYSMIWGSLAGGTIATAAGAAIYGHKSATDGAWGFNGVLVGCALTALPIAASRPFMWALLALGAALSPVAKKTLDKALSKVGSSSLTLPFVIITWLAIMILGTSPANSMDASLAATGTVGFSTAILKGLSEVFLADSAITGFIFIAALAADSLRSAVLALFGSAIGIAAATIAGASPEAIGNGLYGFSPALTAIAVGSRFDKLGIAPLTAPFCIATLLSARK